MTKFFQILYGFIAMLGHNSVQNVIKLISDRAKEFSFRRSESSLIALIPRYCC